jgi:hypothetical protein
MSSRPAWATWSDSVSKILKEGREREGGRVGGREDMPKLYAENMQILQHFAEETCASLDFSIQMALGCPLWGAVLESMPMTLRGNSI